MRIARSHPFRWLLQASFLCVPAGGAVAQASAGAPDFSGAWRLDETGSDTADALQDLLRAEAQREAPPAPDAAGPAPGADAGGGRRGGMGHGGRGMGGHGQHGGGRGRAAPDAGTAPAAPRAYALPPLLKADSVLLVQQAGASVQVQLDDGERLEVRPDDRERQTLNGSALARCRYDGAALRVTLRYAGGARLDQRWERSPDGRRLTVTGDWKVPELKQAVRFRRSYAILD